MRYHLMLCMLLATSAFAETRAEEAKRHFTRSRELYDDGDFAAALNELERAYAAVPNFKLLFNIGQIQAQVQNYAGALKSFRRFLVDGGNEVTEVRRAEVLKEIDKLRTRVAELSLVAPEGTEVSIDDVVIGKAPFADPITVNVGRRRVSATLTDHFPFSRTVDVAGLDSINLKLELQPMMTRSATTAPTAALPSTGVAVAAPSRPMPAWIPWVGVGLLAGATGVTGGLAMSASGRQTQLIGTFGTARADLDTAVTQTRTLALVTDVLGGFTIAAAAGALIYTIVRPADPPPVALGFTTNSVVVTGQF